MGCVYKLLLLSLHCSQRLFGVELEVLGIMMTVDNNNNIQKHHTAHTTSCQNAQLFINCAWVLKQVRSEH